MSRTAARSISTAVLLVAATALPASAVGGAASPPPAQPVTVADGLAGPLTFDAKPDGTLYVGQAFSAALTVISPDGTRTDVVSPTGAPGDVASVSERKGVLTWSQTAFGEQGPMASVLMRRAADGTISQLADMFAYETANNPDSVVTYGFQGLAPECAAMLPPDFQAYPGHIDSHPYGSVSVAGATYVADAGANAILKVTDAGVISTVAVIPGRAFTVTADMAAGMGFPSCVADHQFVLEAVPTDVELGMDGSLYVSSLPGGPEDGSLGNLGSVYRVNPATGAVTLVATGFAGATGIAVTPNGTIYVAELYGNQLSKISRSGVVSKVMDVTQPAAVEWSHGRLYVSTNVFGNGSIISFKAL